MGSIVIPCTQHLKVFEPAKKTKKKKVVEESQKSTRGIHIVVGHLDDEYQYQAPEISVVLFPYEWELVQKDYCYIVCKYRVFYLYFSEKIEVEELKNKCLRELYNV